MDQKALFNLSYGVFVLSTKEGEKKNGCITNTCIQVANNPVRVAISVLNVNYTCELLKQSRVFNLSILDQTCPVELINHFGTQSGREVDKFAGMDLKEDIHGVPYLQKHVCSVLSCQVLDSIDLGSHTLFVAEVKDAFRTGSGEPLTYAYYQKHIKQRNTGQRQEREIIGWRCKICNYVYEGSELPEDFICPLCGHGAEDFEPIYKDV